MNTPPQLAPATPAEPPDRKDIQGLISRGYGRNPAACYALLQIVDSGATKHWLAGIADELTSCEGEPPELCLNIAFTHAGLQTLQLPDKTLDGFQRELKEGMATEHRQRVLGDFGESDPQHWRFGGPHNDQTHVLLMLFARDQAALADFYKAHEQRWRDGGLKELLALRSDVPPHTEGGRKEHFGFADGISQPLIEGLVAPERDIKPSDGLNKIAVGEIVLGYPNGYGQLPDSPDVPPLGTRDILLSGMLRDFPPVSRKSDKELGLRDFGRNGSYMVFRQLRQDVRAFWRFVAEASRDADGQPNIDAAIRLATKMIGRWPGGAPLAQSPDADDPALSQSNEYGYRDDDREGLKCPLGSHIRRTNPRDDMPEMKTADESTRVVNRHRILRRGRRYGQPLNAAFDIADMIRRSLSDATPTEADDERGLIFACFVANIGRQFEFIQNTWVNNQKFAGLYENADPIIGFHDPFQTGQSHGTFTVPTQPVRCRYTGLQQWVTTMGGEYLFMPGINATRFLAGV